MSRKVGISTTADPIEAQVVEGGENEGSTSKGVDYHEKTAVNVLHDTNPSVSAQQLSRHPPQGKRRMSVEMALGALQQTVDKPVSFMIKLAKHK